jgi:ribonuclease P protein subunit POP4
MKVLVHQREEVSEISQFHEIPNTKKVQKKKKRKLQKKRMSRKEMKQLGMYSLPKEKLLYEDYTDLNELWDGYMLEQFGGDMEKIKEQLDCTSPQFDFTSGLIHKSDFHGAKIKVVQSKNESLVDHKGIIIMETKETFYILSRDNILRGEF